VTQNFRFTAELRTKLQLDGYPLNPAYSTAIRSKKPLVCTGNVTQTQSSPTNFHEKKSTSLLSNLLQPQKKTNPMYQSRMNLSKVGVGNSSETNFSESQEDEQISISNITKNSKTKNNTNGIVVEKEIIEAPCTKSFHFDTTATTNTYGIVESSSTINNSFTFLPTSNNTNQQWNNSNSRNPQSHRFSIAREQTFLVRDKPPIVFSSNAYKMAGNNLSRKLSNESIVSSSSISAGIATEDNTIKNSTAAILSSTVIENNNKKRFSFHAPPNSLLKKNLSFSDSLEDSNSNEIQTNPNFSHASNGRGILPVTTLTFSLGPTGNPYHSSQVGPSNNSNFSFSSSPASYNFVKSPTYPLNTANNKQQPTGSLLSPSSSSGGIKKRLSTTNLAPLNFSINENSQMKSLPVSVFGSSIPNTKKENGSSESFLPKMNASKMGVPFEDANNSSLLKLGMY